MMAHLSMSWSLSSRGSPLGILEELKRGGTDREGGGGPTELAKDFGMRAGREGGSGDGVGDTPSSMSSFGGDPESKTLLFCKSSSLFMFVSFKNKNNDHPVTSAARCFPVVVAGRPTAGHSGDATSTGLVGRGRPALKGRVRRAHGVGRAGGLGCGAAATPLHLVVVGVMVLLMLLMVLLMLMVDTEQRVLYKRWANTLAKSLKNRHPLSEHYRHVLACYSTVVVGL